MSPAVDPLIGRAVKVRSDATIGRSMCRGRLARRSGDILIIEREDKYGGGIMAALRAEVTISRRPAHIKRFAEGQVPPSRIGGRKKKRRSK